MEASTKSMNIRLMSIALFFMQAVDTFCTVKLVGMGATEVNPLMHALLSLGNEQFVVFKLALAVVTCAYVFFYASEIGKKFSYALSFLVALYALVCVNHAVQYLFFS